MGGVKHDEGKLEWDKFPWEAASGVLEVMHFGAEKYGWNNWRQGLKWSRLVAALVRHLLAWLGNRGPDPESGLSPLAHVCCCALFLLEYERRGLGTDDRAEVTGCDRDADRPARHDSVGGGEQRYRPSSTNVSLSDQLRYS